MNIPPRWKRSNGDCMAKTALNKDLFREIRRTKNRFISILLLVVIAVAFLYGLRISAPDMHASMDAYLDDQSMMDIHIMSTLGLTDDDVTAVAETAGVQKAEGVYTVDAVASDGSDATVVVKAISLTQNGINEPALSEGRLPEKADEILVEKRFLSSLGVEIGDKVFLDTGTGAYENCLAVTECTIVGAAEHPLYTSVSRGTSTLGNGSVGAVVMLLPEAYEMDYYTDLYALAAGAGELNAYGNEYETLMDDCVAQIEAIQGERETARTAQVKDEAQEEWDDGKAEYDAAKDRAERSLNDAWRELQNAAARLRDGQQSYDDGIRQLESGRQHLAAGRGELEAARKELEAGEASYIDGRNRYEEAESAYDDGLEQYNAGYSQYQDQVQQYEKVEAAYNSSLKEYETAAAELEKAQTEYETAVTQWQAAVAELERKRQELLDSGMDEAGVDAALGEEQAALDSKKSELDTEKNVLDEKVSALAEEKAKLDAAKEGLDANKSALDAAGETLSGEKAKLDASRSQLDQAGAELQTSRDQLDYGWLKYDSGVFAAAAEEKKITLAALTLEEAYQSLVSGRAAYESGLAEYEKGKVEAERELADAEAELNDAKAEIDDIENAEWYVLDRNTNIGFAGYKQDSERMDKLATVFPTVFFLVAALVCLTGMTRMVEEQRVQIGALKALGYSKGDICRKYVGYGFISSLIGSVIGLAIGATVIPGVIVSCWKVMYDYPGVELTFDFGFALVCVALAVSCCALTALAAVLASLRESPAMLMRPKAPKAGKRVLLERVTLIWKHLSFDRKVACRNLFRYKKRFWMTVIGIAGCTALIVTGFGLHNSITDIIDLQYEKVSSYAAVLYTDEDVSLDERKELYAALDEETELDKYTSCYLDTVTMETDTYSIDGNILVVNDPADLEGFWDFHDRKTGEPVEMGGDGVLLSEKTASLLGLEIGDTMTVVCDNKRGQVEVSGIIENYVNHYVFLTKDYCENALGFRPEDTQVLLAYDASSDWEGMGSRLLSLDQVTGINYQKEARDMVKKQLNGVYPAVVIIIIAAASLAFVVLFNLSSINLTERRRELATLRVIGLRDKEMRNYVFRENVILTFLGIALGLVMGNLLHAFLMSTIEIDLVMFGRDIHLLSYLLSVGMTLFFAFIVNIFSGRSLAKIDMVESLKSVE